MDTQLDSKFAVSRLPEKLFLLSQQGDEAPDMAGGADSKKPADHRQQCAQSRLCHRTVSAVHASEGCGCLQRVELCGAAGGVGLRGGHLLQRQLLQRLLAQEARPHARPHLLQRAHLPRRGPPLRLRLPPVLVSPHPCSPCFPECQTQSSCLCPDIRYVSATLRAKDSPAAACAQTPGTCVLHTEGSQSHLQLQCLVQNLIYWTCHVSM